jgi:acyl-CoA synthetase (NDP forming)
LDNWTKSCARLKRDPGVINSSIRELSLLDATRDPTFGPVLPFGLGGIYTEAFQETSARVAPITRRDAEGTVPESNASTLLKGVRGHQASDRQAVVESLLRLLQLMMDFPEIEGIAINLLMVLDQDNHGDCYLQDCFPNSG